MPRTIHWKPASFANRLGLSVQQKKALNETASLTAKFKQHCPDLSVEILSEKQEIPLAYERQYLDLANNQKAWVRCIVLKCGEEPLLYARTVIANLTAGNAWLDIQKIGTQPLGEILFNLKTVQRTPFQICYQRYPWPYLTSNKMTTEKLPARVSTFTQQNDHLLLTEVFLN